MEYKEYEDFRVNICGQGAPLMMIHGIISDGTFFRKSADLLAKNYKVITYDRRGYGQNNQAGYSDYSVHAQAEDAAGILRMTDSGAAWILGNSAGGLIGLEIALCYPELVKGMILVESSLGYDAGEREKLLDWNRELNGYLPEGKIERALLAFARAIGRQEGRNASSSLKEMRQTYQNLQAFMYGELNEVQHYLPPIEKLKQLKMPIYVAVTEKGCDSIFATSSETAARLLDWPILRLPGYHNVAKDMPEEFSRLVHETIKRTLLNG